MDWLTKWQAGKQHGLGTALPRLQRDCSGLRLSRKERKPGPVEIEGLAIDRHCAVDRHDEGVMTCRHRHDQFGTIFKKDVEQVHLGWRRQRRTRLTITAQWHPDFCAGQL